jgi:hypothetical protein
LQSYEDLTIGDIHVKTPDSLTNEETSGGLPFKSKVAEANRIYLDQYDDPLNEENIFKKCEKSLVRLKDFQVFVYLLSSANSRELLCWINGLLRKFCTRDSLTLNFEEFQE